MTGVRRFVAAGVAALAAGCGATPLPLTIAESSGFTRTSRSVEVERFVDACVAASPKLARLSLATSTQGRDVPLVLVADPPLSSLAQARASGKLVVLVMANIHAGEVEGKEAVQLLLRELAQGEHADLLERLVVAFVPDYNPDGNDAIDRRNRPDQNGPIDGVGQRANGQGLDLNRDYVKVEAPETRGLLAAVNELDAAIVMDLHTTDGSFHGYELTYAGAMHPASDPALLQFTAATLLPALRADMRARGFETFDYGDFGPDRERGPDAQAWFTFDHKPRYGTNYFGLGNRIALLSEAYSHESFEVRVRATREFVLAALQFAADHAGELARLRAGADARAAGLAAAGASLPARGAMALTRERDTVLVGACREEKDPVTGLVRVIDTGESHAVDMGVHASFEGRDERRLPVAWAIEDPARAIEPLLAAHGLRVERLSAPRRARVRAFEVAARTEESRPFQGHRLVALAGTDVERDAELPAGTLLVPADQPLARLAFVLLEPTSDDGLGTWGLLGAPAGGPAAPERFPVVRIVTWKE